MFYIQLMFFYPTHVLLSQPMFFYLTHVFLSQPIFFFPNLCSSFPTHVLLSQPMLYFPNPYNSISSHVFQSQPFHLLSDPNPISASIPLLLYLFIERMKLEQSFKFRILLSFWSIYLSLQFCWCIYLSIHLSIFLFVHFYSFPLYGLVVNL